MDRNRLKQLGVVAGLVLTVAAVAFATTLYWGEIQVEDNIVYMAVYYDGLAVSSWESGAEGYELASYQAWQWCELYFAEMRTLSWQRYKPACDAVQEHSTLMIMCSNREPEKDSDCPNNPIYEQAVLRDLRASWRERPPYVSYVFGGGHGGLCSLGNQIVDCIPGD